MRPCYPILSTKKIKICGLSVKQSKNQYWVFIFFQCVVWSLLEAILCGRLILTLKPRPLVRFVILANICCKYLDSADDG